MMEDLTKLATITVTFYGSVGWLDAEFFPEPKRDTFEQKYYLTGWQNEEEARRLIDEIARELHFLSGHGILSVEAQSDEFSFSVSYEEQLIPFDEQESYFLKMLRIYIGDDLDNNSVRITLPRVNAFDTFITRCENYTGRYEKRIKFLQLALNSKMRRRPRGGLSECSMNYNNRHSILHSFSMKIFHPHRIFFPYAKKFDHRLRFPHVYDGSISLELWTLPERQRTYFKFKRQQKKEKEEKRLQKKIKQAGMIPKEQRKKEKPNQVYVIQMMDDGELVTCKIGVSKTPKKRLTALQTSNPHKLEIVHVFPSDSAEDAEARLHERYDHAHINGEWFRLTKEQMAELTQIVGYEQGKFMTNAASS